MEEQQQFEMTRDFIQKSKPNSIDIANNEESYEKYFKLGGTVGKMTVVTAQKYFLYKQKKIGSQENDKVET